MNTIHKATLNDVPRLLHLIHGYWKFESIVGFDAERLAPQLERFIREPTLGTAWIGVQDGRVVGYLIAVYVFSIEFMGLVAEFDEFFIEAEGRGNGLGTEMIRVAEEGCRGGLPRRVAGNRDAHIYRYRLREIIIPLAGSMAVRAFGVERVTNCSKKY